MQYPYSPPPPRLPRRRRPPGTRSQTDWDSCRGNQCNVDTNACETNPKGPNARKGIVGGVMVGIVVGIILLATALGVGGVLLHNKVR